MQFVALLWNICMVLCLFSFHQVATEYTDLILHDTRCLHLLLFSRVQSTYIEELGYFLQIVILRFPVSLNVHSVHGILAALLKCYTSLEPIHCKQSSNTKNTFSAVLSHEFYFVGSPFFNICCEAHCMFL
jgi:hypothetical protein